MKRILTLIVCILMLFSLTSCAAIKALKYSISGDIVDPVEDFSFGDEDGTLIYRDNKYISVDEIKGEGTVDDNGDYIMLGYTTFFPFFPGSQFHTNSDENPKYILSSPGYIYLREDLYNCGLVYVLEDGSFEFEFSDAFFETDEVDWDDHVPKTNPTYTKWDTLTFRMKYVPEVIVKRKVYLINGTWYAFDEYGDHAYLMCDELVNLLEQDSE